jgi:hypothetical protein
MNFSFTTNLTYALLILWGLSSVYLLYRVYTKKSLQAVNPGIYSLIPSIFTTLGVFGTFLGIYAGLKNFNEDRIDESIPYLLEGMKSAFSTSIWGIGLSVLSKFIMNTIERGIEKKTGRKPSGELGALQEILSVLKESKDQNNEGFQKLNNALIGDSDSSLATQMIKVRDRIGELVSSQNHQSTLIEGVRQSLGGDGETSLLTQIQKLRVENSDGQRELNKEIKGIAEDLRANQDSLRSQFNEFKDLLAKSNTEALVEVMKKVTEEFNKQMSDLINRLVQENFEELNKSVNRLNTWQQENKEMISKLTDQFVSVSSEIAITSNAIKEITLNTSKLTDDNSKLNQMIFELQKVMIEDGKFNSIVEKLNQTIETVKQNIDAFDDTTDKLNNWVKNQMNFNDSVAKLLSRLEEIDKIKDINDVFWNNTKKQLEEGVSLIDKGSKQLARDLESVNGQFYEQLNDTLQNLDSLIERIITNYSKN